MAWRKPKRETSPMKSRQRRHRTRGDLPRRYSRKHYNPRHRAKMGFESEIEARAYINKYDKLTGYEAYKCNECGK